MPSRDGRAEGGEIEGGDTLQEWLVVITRNVIVIIQAMALVVIATGTAEAFYKGCRVMFHPAETDWAFRRVWARYARCLVAGLTFQLAADIVETAIAPGWQDIGRLAAVAVIRTFLNYFLERDLVEARGGE
jgi:uncharacterized membrane protein